MWLLIVEARQSKVLFLPGFTIKKEYIQNADVKLIGTDMHNLKPSSSWLLLLKYYLEHRYYSVSVRVGHRVEVGCSVGCHATCGRYERANRCLIVSRLSTSIMFWGLNILTDRGT